MTARQRGCRLLLGPVLALLAWSGLSLGAPAAQAFPAASCTAPNIAVLVQFPNNGGSKTGCASSAGSPSGWAVLVAAGFTVQGTAQYPDTFVCRIDSIPNSACSSTPSRNASWSYWHADPGDTDWTFWPAGAADTRPKAGSVEGWAFGPNPPTVPPAGLLPTAAPPPVVAAPTATAGSAGGGSGPVTSSPNTTTTTLPGETPSATGTVAHTEPASPTSSSGQSDPPGDSPRTAADEKAAGHGSVWPSVIAGILFALLVAGGLGIAWWRRQREEPGDEQDMSLHRLPRPLHPGAWWLWAAGLAVAASRTTNPLLLLLIVGVAAYVVAARRSNAPWARAFRFYLTFGLVVIGLRVLLRCIFGGDESPTSHVLARIPQVPLPSWAAGVRIGGPISVEGVLAATYDGLRLATLLCCVGAASTLANPKRTLRLLPGALYELGMAVVVAVSAAPQLVESTQRVLRAQRLRGGIGRGRNALRTVVAPVMHDALDRSLALAAAMDSRGYGRRAAVPANARRTTGALLVAGLLGLCVGAYGLLGASETPGLALPGIAGGVTLCVLGLALGSKRIAHTEYRPDPWAWPEWLVAGSGVVCATLFIIASHLDPSGVFPAASPLRWPTLPWLGIVGVFVALLPAMAAPPVAVAVSVRPPARTNGNTPASSTEVAA